MQPKTIRHTKTVALSGILDAYKGRFSAPQQSVIDGFCYVVKTVIGLDIDQKHISYTPSTRTIFVRGPDMMKQELKMREQEIFSAITEKMGKKNTPLHIL